MLDCLRRRGALPALSDLCSQNQGQLFLFVRFRGYGPCPNPIIPISPIFPNQLNSQLNLGGVRDLGSGLTLETKNGQKLVQGPRKRLARTKKVSGWLLSPVF